MECPKWQRRLLKGEFLLYLLLCERQEEFGKREGAEIDGEMFHNQGEFL